MVLWKLTTIDAPMPGHVDDVGRSAESMTWWPRMRGIWTKKGLQSFEEILEIRGRVHVPAITLRADQDATIGDDAVDDVSHSGLPAPGVIRRIARSGVPNGSQLSSA